MALRLRFGDSALIDEALHKRVVMSDLRERAIAKQVRAGISDVRDGDLVAGSQQCGDRCAHALQLRLLLDCLTQLSVRSAQRLSESVQSFIGARALGVEADDFTNRD